MGRQKLVLESKFGLHVCEPIPVQLDLILGKFVTKAMMVFELEINEHYAGRRLV